MVDNVTTLALAWYYTEDIRYAKQGAFLAREYFLGPQGMYPTLEFAQDGDRTGRMSDLSPHLLTRSIPLHFFFT